MYQTTEQPMTEGERKRLLDCLPLMPSPFLTRDFKLKLLWEVVAMVIASVIAISFRKTPAMFVIPAVLVIFAIRWLFHFKGWILKPLRGWRKANERVQAFHRAVAQARTVRVHCVETDKVVEVAYDEGTICLFDVGQGRTYWIAPYCMVPGRPPENWPNKRFEIVEVPGWPEEVGPFCSGKYLTPSDTFDFGDFFGPDGFEPPTDGLIPQPLEVFLKEIETRNPV